MFTIRHFGNEFQAGGCTIRQAVNDNNIDVGNNDPFVNGEAVTMDTTPRDGQLVTFRPKASGKAA